MPYHDDGGYELPENIHLWQVSFAHKCLFDDFNEFMRRWRVGFELRVARDLPSTSTALEMALRIASTAARFLAEGPTPRFHPDTAPPSGRPAGPSPR